MSIVSTLFDGKLNILLSFFISSFFTYKNIEFCVSHIGFQMLCIVLVYVPVLSFNML